MGALFLPTSIHCLFLSRFLQAPPGFWLSAGPWRDLMQGLSLHYPAASRLCSDRTRLVTDCDSFSELISHKNLSPKLLSQASRLEADIKTPWVIELDLLLLKVRGLRFKWLVSIPKKRVPLQRQWRIQFIFVVQVLVFSIILINQW